MDLANVMDQISDRLKTITDLEVYAYPAKTVIAPAALVVYPETVTFDETYGRGMDRISLPVVVVVGVKDSESTRDAVLAYCNGSGARSVKAVLESGTYTAFDELRVTEVNVDAVTVAGVEYVGALFTLDIVGSGS